MHRGRAVHAQGPRGEIRQRAPRNYCRRTADSDTRSCTTTSAAAWAGERACPYCNKVFSFAMQREHLMKKRARSAPPAVMPSWTDECPHCKTTFGSERAVRVHKTQCRDRRLAAGLSVGQQQRECECVTMTCRLERTRTPLPPPPPPTKDVGVHGQARGSASSVGGYDKQCSCQGEKGKGEGGRSRA